MEEEAELMTWMEESRFGAWMVWVAENRMAVWIAGAGMVVLVASTRMATFIRSTRMVTWVADTRLAAWVISIVVSFVNFFKAFWRDQLCRRTTRSRKSSWTMYGDHDSLTSELVVERTVDGQKQARSCTTETFPRPDGERHDFGRHDRAAQNVAGLPSYAKSQRITHYSTRNSELADAMEKSDAESEKEKAEIVRSLMDMMAHRSSVE
ncbi:hypothetical protein ACOMHN_060097 [Nucella lapillus]